MVRLSLLGPTTCFGPSGEELPGVIRSRKRLALLAYLAVARPQGFHRRDSIIGLLWPESDQKRARGALRQAVRHLRSELGQVVVSRGTEELGLDWSQFWCDVVEFRSHMAAQRSEEALALYSTELLDGFYLARTPAFESWLDQERRRLRRTAADAAWTLAESSDGSVGERWARRAAAFAPYDEASVQKLMSFHESAGDTFAALRVFERFETRVREEFEGSPSPNTVALAEAIRQKVADRLDSVSRPRLRAPTKSGSQTGGPRSSTDSTEASGRQVVLQLPATRSRGRAVALAGVGVLVLAAVAAWRWMDSDSVTFEFQASSRVTAAEGPEIMPALSPDGDRVVFAQPSDERTQIWMRRVSGGAPVLLSPDSLGHHARPIWAPGGEAVVYLAGWDREGYREIMVTSATGGPPRKVHEASATTLLHGPDWSPDGRHLAFAEGRELVRLDLESGDTTHLAQHWAPHSLAWSPDGSLIAFVSENTPFLRGANRAPSSVWVVSATGGEPVRITPDASTDQSPVWWPSGHELLFVSDRAGPLDIYSVEVARDGRPSSEPDRLTTNLGLLSFDISADGRRLIYAKMSVDWDIWWIPFPDAGQVARLEGGTRVTSAEQRIETLAISPDGRWVAFDSNRDGGQDIYRVASGGGDVLKLTRSAADEFGATWSPDSRQLAYYSFRNGNRDIYVSDLEGRAETQVTGDPGSDSFPHWAPDGSGLLFQHNPAMGDRESPEIRSIRRDGRGDWLEAESMGSGYAELPRWSPDGQWIAYSTLEGLEIRDAAGDHTQLIHAHEDWAGAPVWSADSETVFFAAAIEGTSGIWALPRAGGELRLIASDDDGPYGRFWFDTDGERIYYTERETEEADLWVAEIAGRP